MLINIDLNELAKEITTKIRDEMSRIKVVDFGEVKNITQLSNNGWTAQVMLPGAESLTNPLNCLSNYIPQVGDWVMIIYPPKSEPVLVDATPMRANSIETPADKYTSADHNHDDRYYTKILSDEKYSSITHDHDGRYYTKILSDDRYAGIYHTHNGSWIWSTTPLLGSWQNNSTGHNTAGYYKDIQGVYHLKGRVRGGDLGTAIFKLPSGPDYIETRVAVSNDAPSVVEIHPDGSVIPVSGYPLLWISLDGITIKV
jgi:hypothetical protein